jgi:hypothetical protein
MDACSYIRDDIRCKSPYTPTGGIPFSPTARNRARLRQYVCSLCSSGVEPLTIPMVLSKIDEKEKAYTEAEIRALILETDASLVKIRLRKEERKERERQDREERNRVADDLQRRLNALRGGLRKRKSYKRSKRSKRSHRSERSTGRKLRNTCS